MRYVVALCLTVLWLAPAAAADIYCNAQGRECSDRPGLNTSIVRSGVVSHPGGNAVVATDPNAPADTSNPGDRVQQQRDDNAALNKAQKELKKDLTDKRSEQCKQAQDYYRKTIDAQMIYKVEKDGTKQTLSDKDADQARLSAKLDMDRICAQAGG
jgi:hypothetical protein